MAFLSSQALLPTVFNPGSLPVSTCQPLMSVFLEAQRWLKSCPQTGWREPSRTLRSSQHLLMSGFSKTCFSTFPRLRPFPTVPHVVVTPQL